MKLSVCFSVYNRPEILDRIIQSIISQKPNFDYEVIIVDDRSDTKEIERICKQYPVTYLRIEGESGWKNPARARNVSYKAATGEIIVCQSGDVEHVGNTLSGLVETLSPGKFVLARVSNVNPNTGELDRNPIPVFTSTQIQRPYFFLGALYRKDLYAVGGNDEQFVNPGFDDDWFAACLINGLGLEPVYTDSVQGHHLAHSHLFQNNFQKVYPSMLLYQDKMQKGIFTASGGSWIL